MADVVLRLSLVELWKGNIDLFSSGLTRAIKLYEEAEDDEGRDFCCDALQICNGKTHGDVRWPFL